MVPFILAAKEATRNVADIGLTEEEKRQLLTESHNNWIRFRGSLQRVWLLVPSSHRTAPPNQ